MNVKIYPITLALTLPDESIIIDDLSPSGPQIIFLEDVFWWLNIANLDFRNAYDNLFVSKRFSFIKYGLPEQSKNEPVQISAMKYRQKKRWTS